VSGNVILLDRAGSKVFQLPVKPAAATRRWSYRYAKRALDVAGALALLPLAVPLLALLMVVVKLSAPRKPWSERHRVVGMGGVPFEIVKVRTVDRVTGRVGWLGRLLRRFGLDELPQLWSVLAGDMSLVGPRPAGELEWRAYAAWKRRRASVKPGLTGLWQVMGRASMPDSGVWVETDIEYVRRWSIWFDLQILAVTPFVVLLGTGR
jgi:lipopolysaccharide/colanic/teichoic acid biosynthesis glycosyltransferase